LTIKTWISLKFDILNNLDRYSSGLDSCLGVVPVDNKFVELSCYKCSLYSSRGNFITAKKENALLKGHSIDIIF